MDKQWSAADGPWRGDGVAIIGMAGRFPQARSVHDFWRNLREARDCISRLSREEMLRDGVSESVMSHERFVPAGGVLDDIELFDAEFFNISPREAESMDPQQRLFLEVMQHALDDAGLDPARAAGPIGVYAGCRLSGYWLRLMHNEEFMSTLGWHQVAAGNDKDFLPTQASFRFNLRGPSVNVQSACSTGMLAVALGCDALMSRQCHVAIAGAASIAVPHRTGYMHQPNSIASPDGKCRPFDAGANGSVLGNGVAAVVLKRVNDAIAAGDRIYGVIRAVAVNNDGSTKSSFAAPSVKAQAEVIGRAIEQAGISAKTLDYIEAHGTATHLGDPIEIAALARVMAACGPRASPCGIGSVKSNIGHLDPVAGIASLIKLALSLHHGEIPASLHFEQPNPAIDFNAAGLRVIRELEPWRRPGTPRRGGVSSFGIGGTNVHAVLEEAPPMAPAAMAERGQHSQLLIVSARTPEALLAQQQQYAAALRTLGDATPLEDVAHTLARGRREFVHRRAVAATSSIQAADLLESPDTHTTVRFLKDREPILLFPGQGAQFRGMARDLYRTEKVFREAASEVLELISSPLGFDARQLLDPSTDESSCEIDVQQTAIAQPLLFAVEYAAARLWMYWGIRPAGMLGHSVGELTAAHLAGVMSLNDAARIVCERGRLMQQMSPGAMLVVGLDAQEASELEDDDVRIAAYNAPKQQTLSGSTAAIDALERSLRKREVGHHRLATSHAFHHPSMQPAAAKLLDTLQGVQLRAPGIPFISCLTGEWITAQQALDPAYWARCIVEPVRFSQGVRTILATAGRVMIECGPGRALTSLVHSHAPDADAVMVSTTANRGDARSERTALLESLGLVWRAGVPVDWDCVYAASGARRASLPGYPFQRKRYWIETAPAAMAHAAASANAPTSSPDIAHVRVWLPKPLAAASAPSSGAWIVLADAWGLGQTIADRMRETGSKVVCVFCGSRFQVLSDAAFCVDRASAGDLQSLIERAGLDSSAVNVVNCWPLDLVSGPLSVERADLGRAVCLDAPTRFLQALAKASRAVASIHTVVARAFSVGPELPDPAVATALGLIRVLPQEVQGIRARLIDITRPRSNVEGRVLVELLVGELTSQATDAVVALRDGVRLVESFAPIPLPPATEARALLPPRGTYLITGGFGGIGGVLARWLASGGPANIALVGRKGAGDAGDGDPRATAARQLIQDLEASGATVLGLAADVASPKDVVRVVNDVTARFGRIHGAIHAAGVAGGGMMLVRDERSVEAVVAPKVRGTVALMEALVPHQPEFMAVCSSFAAVGGGIGQGDYCAANAFMDSAVSYARAFGMRAIAINWPAWREVGMVEAMQVPPQLEPLRQASLATGITPQEGAERFARVLASNYAQVIMAPVTRTASEARQHAPAPTKRPASVAIAHPRPPAPASPSHGETPQRAPGRVVEPTLDGGMAGDLQEALIERLNGIWSNALGVAKLQPSDNFFEVGGQSLMALQIVSRVCEQFPIEIALSDVFENPTLRRFGELVHTRLVEHLAAMPDETVRQMLA
jgi:acyl transferase domain-containing protein